MIEKERRKKKVKEIFDTNSWEETKKMLLSGTPRRSTRKTTTTFNWDERCARRERFNPKKCYE